MLLRKYFYENILCKSANLIFFSPKLFSRNYVTIYHGIFYAVSSQQRLPAQKIPAWTFENWQYCYWLERESRHGKRQSGLSTVFSSGDVWLCDAVLPNANTFYNPGYLLLLIASLSSLHRAASPKHLQTMKVG